MTGASGLQKARQDATLTLIDSKTAAAAAGIRGQAVDSTVSEIRDRTPFDAEKFVNDIMGS